MRAPTRVAEVTLTSVGRVWTPMHFVLAAGGSVRAASSCSSDVPRAEGQPRFGDRRKAKRQAAGWESRYRVVDVEREHLHYAGDDYETCVLTDLSMEGAGVHLVAGEVTVGDRVELDLPLGENRHASIQVTAEVRHATVDDGSPPRAGTRVHRRR